MKSNSDCEVIIHLYKMYGINYLFELLDGVFAFVLYDSNVQRVFVARDPYGVRPLYYHDNCGITIASEIKQIKEIGINVKQFEPGTFMEIELYKNNNPNIIRQQKYTSFGFSKMIFNNLYDIYGILYQTLYNAVRKRVIGTTERPIACLLSGGLDSSTIAALVNSFLPKGQLETYSIGLEGSTDLVYSQKVADHLGTKHTQIVLTEDQFLKLFQKLSRQLKATTLRQFVQALVITLLESIYLNTLKLRLSSMAMVPMNLWVDTVISTLHQKKLNLTVNANVFSQISITLMFFGVTVVSAHMVWSHALHSLTVHWFRCIFRFLQTFVTIVTTTSLRSFYFVEQLHL